VTTTTFPFREKSSRRESGLGTGIGIVMDGGGLVDGFFVWGWRMEVDGIEVEVVDERRKVSIGRKDLLSRG
jgi:hypothetical protein